MAYKIIMDVDTGTDDAVAIMMAIASPEIDLMAITTVNGNRNVELTTNNTLRVIDYLGISVPVYKGCALPMVATLNPARKVLIPRGDKPFDGEENHGNHLDLPDTDLQPEPLNAVSYLINTLMASDGDITIVAIGPLTNIAVAMRAEPRISAKIKEIIIMGGGNIEGNIGRMQRAEFNFWVDPEAVEIVLRSGCKMTVVPLDVTYANCIREEEAADFDAMGTKAGKAAALFIRRRIGHYSKWQPMERQDEAPIHDALCIAGLLDRSVFTEVKTVHMEMDYSGGTSDGMSIVNFKPLVRDLDGKFRPAPQNVDLVMGADRDKFAAIMKDLLSRI